MTDAGSSSTARPARAAREQVGRDDVRRRTGAPPFARASFTLVEGLGIVPPAGGDGGTA